MEDKISREVNSKIEQTCKFINIDSSRECNVDEQAYIISEKYDIQLQRGRNLMSLCTVYRTKGKVSKWLKCAYAALEIFEDIDEKREKVNALHMIATAYYYSGVYDKAIQYLFEALILCDDIKDDDMFTFVLSNMGEIYRESKKFNEALEYNNKAYEICKEKELDENRGYILKNIGKVYFDMGRFDDAMDYLSRSYDRAIIHKNITEIGQIESQMGNIYAELEDYERAKLCYKKSLKKFKNIKDVLYEIDALIGLGKIALKEKASKATNYFDKAIRHCNRINNDRKLSHIYSILADYYEENENYKLALEYQKKHYNLHEKINTIMIGYKLETINFELDKLNMNSKIESFRIINERLENEIHIHEDKVKELTTLNDSLKEKANHDHLTGIANRHFIDTYMNNLWSECETKNENIFVMIMDIDDFKRFNDYWGHSAGDNCLKSVADVLNEKGLSSKSLIGRYGGEEFIFFRSDLTYDEALNIGEVFRASVSELNIKYSEESTETLTLSIGGVIGYTSELNDIKTAIDIADKQLYVSKKAGKNMANIISTTIQNHI